MYLNYLYYITISSKFNFIVYYLCIFHCISYTDRTSYCLLLFITKELEYLLVTFKVKVDEIGPKHKYLFV